MAWCAAQLITAWESAAALPAIPRTALLLVLDGRAETVEAALALDVGLAASLLAQSYRAAFGEELAVTVPCPACGAVLEAALTVPSAAPGPAATRLGGWELRAPTLAELAEAMGAVDPAATLRERCLSQPAAGADAPDESEIDRALDRIAGAAAQHAAVTCADCGATFDSDLDIAALLWQRICDEALWLLADVAALAAAFGWTEAAVLALPAPRRAHYLNLVGAAR